MASLTLSIVEIVVLMIGAIVLGITIHFFIVSRRALRANAPITQVTQNKQLEEWKYKYFNEIEIRDKEITSLREQLEEVRTNDNINSIEAEELRKQNRKLASEIEALKKAVPAQTESHSYLDQLHRAQSSLQDNNIMISELLDQIAAIRESEEKNTRLVEENEELNNLVSDLQSMIVEKDKEVASIRQKAHLTREMSSMLDNAYSEFSTLQNKIEKLEAQLASSKTANVENEGLKEEHARAITELEEARQKLNYFNSENQQLTQKLNDAEERLRDTEFQRQQLARKVAYLEELKDDMQTVTEANKKLEGQIRRIGELESMLNMLSEERDQLMRRHTGI